jgi:hypothetical protein
MGWNSKLITQQLLLVFLISFVYRRDVADLNVI